MSVISKDDVLNLREKTGAGLIDCKRALMESNGDLEEAVSILRKKGVASAAKKAGRDAGEGVIAQCVSSDRSKGVLVEVNCETDFVAKNDDFVAFAGEVAGLLLSDPHMDLESTRTEQVAKIGENIRISRSQEIAVNGSGLVASYVHTGGKVAVLLSLGVDSPDIANDAKVLSLAKDLCMHVAATSPVCVSREDVPEELVVKERDIANAQAEGKPPQAVEKIVQGKLDKYFSNACLIEQPFVKDPDNLIKDLLNSVGQDVGCDLKVENFIRFQVGEGN